jgi:hypothetical protein
MSCAKETEVGTTFKIIERRIISAARAITNVSLRSGNTLHPHIKFLIVTTKRSIHRAHILLIELTNGYGKIMAKI